MSEIEVLIGLYEQELQEKQIVDATLAIRLSVLKAFQTESQHLLTLQLCQQVKSRIAENTSCYFKTLARIPHEWSEDVRQQCQQDLKKVLDSLNNQEIENLMSILRNLRK